MDATTAQRYVRVAGLLIFISILAGAFGEVYVPSKLISSDAIETAKNIASNDFLFRCSFAIYLIEAICDIALSLIFYVLLKPVNKEIALLAALFGMVSTATYAFAEFFYFAPSLFFLDGSDAKILSSMNSSDLIQASLVLYQYGGTVFMVFYGFVSLLRGYLLFKAAYLPKFLGVLLVLGGAGFVIKNFVFVLWPSHDSGLFLLPMFVAMISLSGWFLLRGIDREKWTARAHRNELLLAERAIAADRANEPHTLRA